MTDPRATPDAVRPSDAITARVIAVLLWPFLPDTTAKIFAQLNLPDAPDQFSAAIAEDRNQPAPRHDIAGP